MPASLLCWCGVARMRGTRIALVSIGAGPVANSLSRALTKVAARLVDYRSYRDTPSKAFMQSIGLDTERDSIYPDLAFGLRFPQTPAATPPDERNVTVGLGLMRYRGWRDDQEQAIYQTYLRKLVRFVTWLLDQGFRVRLLIGDQVDQVAVDDFL